jgi:hypothetical protein
MERKLAIRQAMQWHSDRLVADLDLASAIARH